MGLPRFARPKGVDGKSSPNLYVANCGPAVGLSIDAISSVFSTFGEVNGVYAADESGTRVIVSYINENAAQAALKALHGRPCPDLGGRFLHIQYSILQPPKQVHTNDSIPVSLVASELNIPGLYLWHDFVTAKEEEELLAAVDDIPWRCLAKRKVQHYGYEFLYEFMPASYDKLRAQFICYGLCTEEKRNSTIEFLESTKKTNKKKNSARNKDKKCQY